MSESNRDGTAKQPGIPSLSPREAERLGMGANITRRDFMGATLLGAGSALMGMAAPGTARGQTTGLPMTGLTPDWTGPGGIGDYGQSNGNTHEVLNNAHGGIRNQEFDALLASATDTGEKFDLLVVGSGISGLSAAWTWHKQRPHGTVMVLDQHPIFGGEAKQNEFEVDGTHLWAPQGSTGMVFPLAQARKAGFYSEFYDELGFPQEFKFQQASNTNVLVPHDIWSPMHIAWEQADIGYWFEGKGWVKNAWRNGWKDAPFADSLKYDLTRMDLYRTPPRRDDWEKWLDSMTYLDFLTKEMGLSPEVTRYLDHQTCSMGCGLGADIISAYSAFNFLQPGVIGYLRDLEKGIGDPADNLYLVSLPGGNAGIARRLVQKMIPAAFTGPSLSSLLLGKLNWAALDRPNQPVRIRVSSTVLAVVHDSASSRAKGVIVYYRNGGKLYKVHGKAVVMAGQQHVNRHICRDVPAEYREAMQQFHHAPMLTVNVAVRNWKFMDKLGISCARWFEGFGWWTGIRRNVLIDGRETMPLDPSQPVVLTSYNPFPQRGLPFPDQCTTARMQLFGMSYADIEGAVRDQYQKMFGEAGFDAKRDIAGITTNRWGHAYVVDPPGFFFGKDGKPAAKDVLRTRHQRMAFSHSELTGAQMWETAAEEGQRAARQILEIS